MGVWPANEVLVVGGGRKYSIKAFLLPLLQEPTIFTKKAKLVWTSVSQGDGEHIVCTSLLKAMARSRKMPFRGGGGLKNIL